ncbi:TonB-dependent siderophore receptor [Roseomonas sp. OT10]|uniref:TonB-dependent siderophore receptor n=1 Tax=Roseomonas cutis TaxID=2897332 RepID=UPI001E384A13|nr:TonB-dependent siderophore receptor [Roseomonas sp. OT10]UFN50839.1 TonB-dependent siderophore receptor [Roseomonas sp. OT10]
MTSHRRRTTLLLCLLAGTALGGTLACHPALGQGADDGVTVLPEVDVQGRGESALDPVRGFVANQQITGTKTDTPLIENPQSISVITRDQIDSRQAQTLGEALRYTAGIRGENYGPDSRTDWFQLRGFNAQDNGLFLNGLRFNTGYAGSVFETYGLERYEVLRGPTSVLYGQIAPGGLINMVQRRPSDEPSGEVRLTAGSYSRWQGQGYSTGRLTPDGTWTYNITGLLRDSDTQVDRVKDNRVYLGPAVTWQPTGDTRITLMGYYQRDQTSGGQFLPYEGTVTRTPYGRISTRRFTGEPDFDRFNRTQYGVGYELQHRFDDVWSVQQNLRYGHTGIDWAQVYGVGLASDGRTLNRFAYRPEIDVNTFQVDNQVQARFATGPLNHQVLMGFDYSQIFYRNLQAFAPVASLDLFNPVYGATIPKLSPPNLNDRQVTTQYGLYAQDQIRFDRFVLTAGIRQDWALADVANRANSPTTTREQNDEAFTWRAGLLYLAPNGLAPYASYARSFQPQIGVDAYGRGFDPLEGEQYEVGIKYQPPGVNSLIQVSAFHLTQRNTLTADPNNLFNQLPVGEVRVRGVEIEGVASLARGLSVIANYTYLDPEITKSSNTAEIGHRPNGVAKNNVAAWADYTFQEGSGGLTGLGLGFGVRFLGNTSATNTGGAVVPSTTLFDAAVRYDLGQLSPSLKGLQAAVNASNLFDTRYVGRCATESSCFYGNRLNVLGSISYRW